MKESRHGPPTRHTRQEPGPRRTPAPTAKRALDCAPRSSSRLTGARGTEGHRLSHRWVTARVTAGMQNQSADCGALWGTSNAATSTNKAKSRAQGWRRQRGRGREGHTATRGPSDVAGEKSALARYLVALRNEHHFSVCFLKTPWFSDTRAETFTDETAQRPGCASTSPWAGKEPGRAARPVGNCWSRVAAAG